MAKPVARTAEGLAITDSAHRVATGTRCSTPRSRTSATNASGKGLDSPMVARPEGRAERGDRDPATPAGRPRWFVEAPPDPPGARRRVDVRRRPACAAAAVPAPAGDGRGRRALRLSRRPVGSAAAHQHIPGGHHVRHRHGRPARGRPGPRHPPPGARAWRPTAGPYRADDPHLLEWAHIAEIDSFLLGLSALRRQAARRGRSRRIRRRHRAGSPHALGVPDPPRTEAAAARASCGLPAPNCAAPTAAREAARFLLVTPPLPILARAPVRGLAVDDSVSMLPAWARLPLRLPYLPPLEATAIRARRPGTGRRHPLGADRDRSRKSPPWRTVSG